MKFGIDVMPLDATLYPYFRFPTVDITNMVDELVTFEKNYLHVIWLYTTMNCKKFLEKSTSLVQ
jgi:hypothetical protein